MSDSDILKFLLEHGATVIQPSNTPRSSTVAGRTTTASDDTQQQQQQVLRQVQLDWEVEVLPVNCNVLMPKTGQPLAIYTRDELRSTDGRKRRTRRRRTLKKNQKGQPVPNVCDQCGKTYATSSNLSRHKQTHRTPDASTSLQCNVCGKVYVSRPALSMHVLTHQLTHACGVCGKLFSRPWLLKGHLRSHTGEKPYGCAYCGKCFADRSNLRAHMHIHLEDRSYSCKRCHRTFALKSYLNKHRETSCYKRDDERDV